MDIPPQVGDLVRVGRGTVPWRVAFLSPIPGVVALSSTKTAMHRSEMLWNLSPLLTKAAVGSAPTAAAAAAAGRTVSRSGGTVGLVVGGFAVAAAGGALAVRLRRDAARKEAARPPAEMNPLGGVDDAPHDAL